MILAIVISLIVLAGAFLLKYLATEVIEEMNVFMIVAGCFILVYVTAAIFLQFLVPGVSGQAKIASFFPAVMAGSSSGF
jgi:hypothetical protein